VFVASTSCYGIRDNFACCCGEEKIELLTGNSNINVLSQY
jgi:hypothetical protein